MKTAFAYTLLQSLPGNVTEISTLSAYLSWLFTFALAAAAFLAVLQIVIGGIQIIAGGASETARSNAKKRIQDALWGLLLAFGAVLILETISPGQFTNLSLTITPVTIEAPAPAPVLAPTPTEFKNSPSPELTTFANCMKKIPGLIITSTTDTNIQSGKCNLTDPNESFSDPNNCQHAKNSCHYGGQNCVSKGSYAIDVDNNIDGKKVAEAAAGCGGSLGAYDKTARCILNENGNHHHITIGAWYNCGCDTSVATCASQK